MTTTGADDTPQTQDGEDDTVLGSVRPAGRRRAGVRPASEEASVTDAPGEADDDT